MKKFSFNAILLFSMIFSISLSAFDAYHPGSHEPYPWWTGTLLSPGASVMPPKHFLEQPYVFVTMANGKYDSQWHPQKIPSFTSVNLQFFTLIGLIQDVDLQITPQWIYNATRGQSSSHFADLPVGFDFQVLTKNEVQWLPSIKIGLKEILPTGRYQKLNPKKFGTDISGTGSFDNQWSIVFFKEYHFTGYHYLSGKLSLIYDHFSRVHVKGFNAYGGGYKTKGTVYPGDVFTLMASFEYSFTRNWVLALDNVYAHGNTDRFFGKSGFSAPGVKATVGFPSFEQISFAPALEYNFSEKFGVIGGLWFTAWGRNTARFQSLVFSALYIF